MDITWSNVIAWLIVGLLAGSLAGMLVRRQKAGYGKLGNLGIGLVGALIGGFLFRLFKIDLGLGDINISLEDLVAALIGAFVFLIILTLIRRGKKSGSSST